MPALDQFLVRFWGVRGSIACPGPGTVRYGGNTSCLEVRCGEYLFIFDAGTGLRPLGLSLIGQAPLDIDLYFTHTHFDHVNGLPFFVPAFMVTAPPMVPGTPARNSAPTRWCCFISVTRRAIDAPALSTNVPPSGSSETSS